jgi:putative transposase
MADAMRMALAELLRKAEVEPRLGELREGIRVLAEALMALVVELHLGAAPRERTPPRTGQRNGYRERAWDTRVGTIALRVPRVRDGQLFPEPAGAPHPGRAGVTGGGPGGLRRGVSTWRADDLVKALGLDGISRGQVSRICTPLDAEADLWFESGGRLQKIDGKEPRTENGRLLSRLL